MKKVPLKTVPLSWGPDEEGTVDYAEQICNMLCRPENPQAGVAPAEMRKVMPILDKVEHAIEAGAAHVLLEDSEHRELAKRANSQTFIRTHRVLLDMVDEIVDAETVQIKEAEAG